MSSHTTAPGLRNTTIQMCPDVQEIRGAEVRGCTFQQPGELPSWNFGNTTSKRDLKSVERIWRECGWIGDDDEVSALEAFFDCGDALVALLDGEAECAVHSTDGAIRWCDEDLSLGTVTAVTTSHIARQTGYARQLTAEMLARQTLAGDEVSALGMFDQEFYDKVGYGTGSYEHWITFDPATLKVDRLRRPPKRVTAKDYVATHAAACTRKRGHGGTNLKTAEVVHAEMEWTESGYGLGYFDGPSGELTHFIWGSAKGEHGAYSVTFRAYQTAEQLLELLGVIKSLADQVNTVGMIEFSDIQLQDLLERPFRQRRALGKQQLARTDRQLCITLGEESTAVTGSKSKLPTLSASVDAFTRLWFGVRGASSLAITDNLAGPPSLPNALERKIVPPAMHTDWDF